MVIEIVDAVVGVFGLLSTWRFAICATTGSAGGYFAAQMVEERGLRLAIFAVILLVAGWCGARWQKSAVPSGTRRSRRHHSRYRKDDR
jgi:uncharacterized membrane protein YfcA